MWTSAETQQQHFPKKNKVQQNNVPASILGSPASPIRGREAVGWSVGFTRRLRFSNPGSITSTRVFHSSYKRSSNAFICFATLKYLALAWHKKNIVVWKNLKERRLFTTLEIFYSCLFLALTGFERNKTREPHQDAVARLRNCLFGKSFTVSNETPNELLWKWSK